MMTTIVDQSIHPRSIAAACGAAHEAPPPPPRLGDAADCDSRRVHGGGTVARSPVPPDTPCAGRRPASWWAGAQGGQQPGGSSEAGSSQASSGQLQPSPSPSDATSGGGGGRRPPR